MIRKALGSIVGSVLALAFMSFVPSARADLADQATQLTFNQPVQLPDNMVLPAGTYWFVMPDYVSGGQITQVFDVHRTRLLGTFLTVPTERTTVSDDGQLTFSKNSPNAPMTLVSWFYPGEATGHELLYSPQQESQLSEGDQITVLARNIPQIE
jgi:hypothetical protein